MFMDEHSISTILWTRKANPSHFLNVEEEKPRPSEKLVMLAAQGPRSSAMLLMKVTCRSTWGTQGSPASLLRDLHGAGQSLGELTVA